MIKLITALILVISVVLAVAGCASSGDYNQGDCPAPYSTGGCSGGGFH